MKAIQFKKITTTMALIMSIGFSTIIHAEDIVIPVISKPAVLQEGIQRDLTPAQIEELLPWAKDSKVFLVDLLENVQTLSASDKVDQLIAGIKSVVSESAPKNSEMLMRYALNRGLVISDLLNQETDAEAVGSVDVKLRVLKASIDMAVKYYDYDMKIVKDKTKIGFADFGLAYYTFLAELNKSVFDASAQYTIQRTALEFLQWDLYRDLENTSYAASIVKINNGLKVFPVKAKSDSQAINIIRQMKSLSSQIVKNKVEPSRRASSKEFETLMAKKQLAEGIFAKIAVISESMRFMSTPEDFFSATSPDNNSPSENYIIALSIVAYENRSILINDLNAGTKDVFKLLKMLNHVEYIGIVTTDYIPHIKTAEDFLTIFSYVVASPSDNYKNLLRKLVSENYDKFMDLNPTESQKQTLINRFK